MSGVFKDFSGLELVRAFTVEGLANARVSPSKVERARIKDQPVTWKLGGMEDDPFSSRTDQLLAKYMPTAQGERATKEGLRLLAPVGRLNSPDLVGGIVGLPAYKAAASLGDDAAFKSFTIDPSSGFGLPNLLGWRAAPALSLPMRVQAPADLIPSFAQSHVAYRGLIDLSPGPGLDAPSLSVDLVEFDAGGLTGPYLAVRFIGAGATAVPLMEKLSFADLASEPLVLLPLNGRTAAEILTLFVYELAHNSPIDVAAWDTVRKYSAQAATPPVVLAPRDFLDQTRLANIIPGLQARLARLEPDQKLNVTADDLVKMNRQAFEGRVPSNPTAGFVRDFLANKDKFVWEHESDSAESTLAIIEGMDALERAGPDPSRASRSTFEKVIDKLPSITVGGGATLGSIGVDLKAVLKSALRMGGAAPPVSAQPRERYTNVKMFDDKGELKKEESLVAARTYILDVSVGTKRAGLTADTPDDQPPVRIFRQTGPAVVWVVLTDETNDGANLQGTAFKFDKRYDKFILPLQGDSQGSARFAITPQPGAFAAGKRGRLGIRLYHKLNLIDHVELDLRVDAGAQTAAGDGRPAIGVTFWRRAKDGGVEPPDETRAARAISISVTRPEGSDFYSFAFVAAEDETGKPGLVATKTLTEGQLNDFVSRFRSALLKTVFGPSLLTPKMSDADRDKLLRELSELGTEIFGALFNFQAGADGFKLGGMIREALPDASIVQIALTGAAQDFVFPWQILTLKPVTRPDDSVTPENLWGYRFVIEVKRLRDGTDSRAVSARAQRPARVLYGRYQEFANEEAHYRFLQKTIEDTAGLLKLEAPPIESYKVFAEALANGGGDLLYVYAHGHAAAPNTAIGHAFNNNLRQQIQTIKETPALALSPDQVKIYQLLLTTTEDTSKSALHLTNSEIALLSLINEVTPDNDPIQLTDAPIVFLNTCQSAQLWNAITDSFVGFFLDRGARAVLGTESTIPIVVSEVFGRSVLTEIFAGKSLGEAVRTARQTLLVEQNNPLGLCYSIYGTADARLFSKPPTHQGEAA